VTEQSYTPAASLYSVAIVYDTGRTPTAVLEMIMPQTGIEPSVFVTTNGIGLEFTRFILPIGAQ
jgi:hypothetical protein